MEIISIVHSLFIFNFRNKLHYEVLIGISSLYYINDIKYVNKMYLFHHLFSMYVFWYCWGDTFLESLIKKVWVVEGSVPFLNLYLLLDKKSSLKKMLLVIYLLSHVYFRNIILIQIYKENFNKLENKSSIIFIIFLCMNFWWTYRTILKIKNFVPIIVPKNTLKDTT